MRMKVRLPVLFAALLLALIGCVSHVRPTAYVSPPWIRTITSERPAPASQPTPYPTPRAAFSTPSPFAFYADLRSIGQFYPSDPLYGAKGDGVTDDLAAFNAAASAAQAAGGTVNIFNPPVAYGLSAMWQVPSGVSVLGNATTLGQCTIRALSPMRAVMAMTTPSAGLTATPSFATRVTLDGNNNAIDGLLLNSSWLTTISYPFVQNTRRDGLHGVGHRLPLILSGVTPGAGGVGGVTVSQYDPNYQGIGNSVTTFTVVSKISTGGALGTAQYMSSFDGGATFATFHQTVTAMSNMAVASAGTFLRDSGLQWVFPAHTYVIGETYTLTAQNQSEFSGAGAANNADTNLVHPWIDTFGSSLVGGTITVVGGANTASGSSTSWLSGAGTGQQPRPGDSVQIVGGGVYPIGSVLDDTDLILPSGETFSTSVSTGSYALGVGYGIFFDDSGDSARPVISGGGLITNGPNGLRMMGGSDGSGYVKDDLRFDTVTSLDILIGGGLLIPLNSTLDVVEMKHQANNLFYYVQSSCSASIREPRQNFVMATDIKGGGTAHIQQQGSTFAYNSAFGGVNTMVPISSLQLGFSGGTTINLTSAAQTINAPDTSGPGPVNQSYVSLHTTADFTLTATPTISAPVANGIVLVVENAMNSTGVIVLQDRHLWSDTLLELEADQETLYPGSKIMFVATGGAPFVPKWTQWGPVSQQSLGNGLNASGDGGGQYFVQTTDATVTTLAPKATASIFPDHGGTRSCDVDGYDTGTTGLGSWKDVTITYDGSGNLLSTVSIGLKMGNNSGAPPATMSDPTFVLSSGKVLLQVQGSAAHTIRWKATCKQLSAVRF
jgi:hypothetical protein